VLSDADALAHLRLRPAGGIDMGALVPEGSQGDRLFRLRSALFASAALDGTWEAAVYVPDEGDPVPPVALALGVRERALAAAAAEHFVAELMQTWPVRRSDFAVGEARGACLLDLRILPAFAPCYVVTQSALVLGYNGDSLRRALAPGTGALGSSGGLLLDLARLPEADARLARAGGAAPAAEPELPWGRVRADGRLDGDAVSLAIALAPGAGS
jgi:hypothetical protein